MLLKLILIYTTFVVAALSDDNDPKVCLNSLGCLQGTKMPGYSGGQYEAFLGVPFAKPPIGNLRFRDPEPVLPWQGVLSAKEAKPDCKQRNYLIPHWPIVGDEDCLYLNIYRPIMNDKEPLPVIFYIYGGGFFSGSSNPSIMGPDYFMETGEVIVVVITYRLGPFGFLSTGCSEMPGNFGLKDQLLALKWVHDYIDTFGGDPSEIALFGHSAGASAVHFHMLNPKTKGLFKRAILSSGNALAPYVGILDKPLDQLHTLAQALGIDAPHNHKPKELADQLREMDADKILEAGDALKFWFNHILFNFRPVIEDGSSSNAYLTEHPYETIKKGNFTLKPWLTGLVSYKGEGAAITLNIYDNENLRAELNSQFDEKMMKLLAIEDFQMFNSLMDVYMQGTHELNAQTRDGFFELFSDYYFYHPVYKTLKHYFDYADTDKNPVYIYKFSYHGPHTYAPIYTNGSTNRYDVVHFDDLLYQFRQSALFPDFEKDSTDAKLVKEFVNILLGFIKHGKPTNYDDIGSCSIEQFLTSGSKGMCKYLELINSDNGYKRVIHNEFYMDRMKLWDSVMKYFDISTIFPLSTIMNYHFLSCYTIVFVLIIAKNVTALRVCTPDAGCFNGRLMSAYASDIEFNAFMGVPYAQKPVRFEPPVLYTGNKELNCTKPVLDCLQKNYLVPSHPVTGGEDCLYLYIYTNWKQTEDLLPVMVYIFGGGFFAGSSNPVITGPEYLMDLDKVIVVTIGYRLGAFGFLATSDGVIPGNLGLKDQLCALKWIQKNIEYFGGNKLKVTLFGQSAGAVSAHMHVLSPLSRDLFQGVIAMSGTANVPFAIDEYPDETARKTAKYCNISNWDTITTTQLRDELKKIDANDLLDAGDHLKYWDVDNLVNYRPIVEKPSETAFLSKHPVEILGTGDYFPVPIMFGRVPNEGGVRVIAIIESDTLRTEFNKDFYNLMVKFLEFPRHFNSSQIDEKMEYILDAYFNGVQELNNDTSGGFLDLVTDRGFYHPLYNAVKTIVNNIDTNLYPVYMYEFNYQGPYTYANFYAGNITKLDYGVVHCDDLIYMFRAPLLFKDFDINSNDAKVIKYFTDDFITFAIERKSKNADLIKHCDQQNFESKISKICEYEEYEKNVDESLNVRIESRFDTSHMTFWDFILEEKYDTC
ncbi:uncharacterized protein ACRADG_011135 [Cochliomyia hominivorax]